ncbi:MAG: UDP-N-acetylglucosamine--N-acetylmuramyl-(pentapeptide) pyrophosphoryl-undecaprenol N-acetylglucosamine transferase [Patescibacteria group bacterium]
MIKILFTAGGSGGHIYPIIATVRELKKIANEQNIKVKLYFMGKTSFGKEDFKAEEVKSIPVLGGKLTRYFSIKSPFELFKFLFDLIESFIALWFIMPDVILSKGGPGSLSVGLVGRLYGARLIIHDSDSIPGLTNRILGKFANFVTVSFPEAGTYFNKNKVSVIGNPIRLSLLNGNKEDKKEKVIFFKGGSQGAEALNKVVIESLRDMLKKYIVYHSVGENNYQKLVKDLKDLYNIDVSKEKNYKARSFFNEKEVTYIYAQSDLIVARAGAGIFEIAANGLPSILIPLPESASDHQRKNAFYYARSKACTVIEQENLKPSILLDQINNIFDNKELYREMSEAAKAFAKPEAAYNLAKILLDLNNYG